MGAVPGDPVVVVGSCVARLSVLLEIVASPLVDAVREVVAAAGAGSGFPKEAVILLDDYCEASVGEYGENTLSDIKLHVAMAAVAASGVDAGVVFERDVLKDALAIWGVVDARAREVGNPAGVLSSNSWVRLEEAFQAADLAAASALAGDPEARARYVSQAPDRMAPYRDQLASVAGSWVREGPCGGACDWPTCDSGESSCVRGRRRQQSLSAGLRRELGLQAPATWYLAVSWLDERDDGGPLEYVSEISADGREVRKVAVGFGDGRVEWADEQHSSDDCTLSAEPVLAVSPMTSAFPRTWAHEITEAEFEAYWAQARAATSGAAE